MFMKKLKTWLRWNSCKIQGTPSKKIGSKDYRRKLILRKFKINNAHDKGVGGRGEEIVLEIHWDKQVAESWEGVWLGVS